MIWNWWNVDLGTARVNTHLILLDVSNVVFHFFNIIKAKLGLAQRVLNELKGVFVFLDPIQAVSLQLGLQDLSVKTGLRDQSRLLLGPFSCSASLEARWCRHSGSPGPEPGHPKLLLDLNGGLLQVRSSITQALLFIRFMTSYPCSSRRSGSDQHLCSGVKLHLCSFHFHNTASLAGHFRMTPIMWWSYSQT